MRISPAAIAAFWLTFGAAGAQTLGSLDAAFEDMNQGSANSRTTSSLYRTIGNEILVKIISTRKDDRSFRQFLESSGVDVKACDSYFCDGFLNSEVYATIRGASSIVSIQPSFVTTSQLGSVVSEAVEAHRIDEYRASVNAATTGAGMKIGVLSDSFDNLNGYAADIASGDLPSGITVLMDLPANAVPAGTDEGRAMLQLIADIAPEAEFFFRTAFLGAADFAAGIGELADAGCDVIVDDITNLAEPFFQDGVIAKAANAVARDRGVPYFSSAGNGGRNSWEGVFSPSAVVIDGCTLHEFGDGVHFQTIVFGAPTTFVFQWDDPFGSLNGAPGVQRDVRVFLINPADGSKIESSEEIDMGGDPVLLFPFFADTWSFAFGLCGGSNSPPLQMKYILTAPTGSIQIQNFATNSPTSFGHPNMPFTAGVGAAFFDNTPEFGISPPLLESFSSAGGTAVIFDEDGTRKATPEVRRQPRFVGVDGTSTTFFGQNGFFGTSAAAPHVAAIALLILQQNSTLDPLAVYSVLQETAIDMRTPGFDFDSGHGLVDGFAALSMVGDPGGGNDDDGAGGNDDGAVGNDDGAGGNSDDEDSDSSEDSGGGGGIRFCFSGQNTVDVHGKGLISMSDLQIGDRVRTCDDDYSLVYSFFHKHADLATDYLRIAMDNNQVLEVTANHLVYANGTPIRAADVKVGDFLSTQTNVVVSIDRHHQAKGLYAPVTLSGDLVVSGACSSSYVTLWEYNLPWLQNWATHAAMAVYRLTCSGSRRGCHGEQYDADTGYAMRYTKWIAFTTWLEAVGGKWGTVLITLLGAPFLAFLLVVEQAWSSHPTMTTSLTVGALTCLLVFWKRGGGQATNSVARCKC